MSTDPFYLGSRALNMRSLSLSLTGINILSNALLSSYLVIPPLLSASNDLNIVLGSNFLF